jgi:hypothetical protein
MTDQEEKTGHSLAIEIEKLDGGFISNISGKRRIYKNAIDVDGAIDISDVLTKVKEDEYILTVELIPKHQYKVIVVEEPQPNVQENIQGLKELPKLSYYEQAKLDGIIKEADKFDPNPAVKPVKEEAVISVTPFNCYSIAQLKAVDWNKYDKEIPLTIREKTDITGIVHSTLYNLLPKVAAGTFQWQSVGTRVGMTILAKYYENIVEKKEKKFGIPPRNDKRLMELVAEVELMCKGGMVKANLITKKMEQFKKLLIQD